MKCKRAKRRLREKRKIYIFFTRGIAGNKKGRIFASSNDGNVLKRVGLVVQLVRIPACHAGGREFESRPDRRKVAQK